MVYVTYVLTHNGNGMFACGYPLKVSSEKSNPEIFDMFEFWPNWVSAMVKKPGVLLGT